MDEAELPLSGIKVVEFTHMVMGPTVGLILADLGADVVKIEPLGGDKTRQLKGSGAGYFPMYNRNKKSISVDLKSKQGKQLALDMIDGADVLVENFRSGAMSKLGFGYDELKSTNPRLIYCSLKGFLSGPYAHRTALDEVTQMMGGLAYMTGLPDQPLRAGSSVIDITGGMFGVIGILSALQRRHKTNTGELVTGSLFETTAFMVGQHMAQQMVDGEEPQPMSVRKSAWAVYDIFKSKDDEKIFVGVVSDTLWQEFCKEFELDEFAADESLNANSERVKQRDRVYSAITELFSNMDKAEMVQRLDRAGVPFAPINRPSDLFDDPHLNFGDALLPVTLCDGESAGAKAKLPALPIEMGGDRFSLRHDLPRVGENVVEVLQELGYSDSKIDKMLEQGVISSDS